jgi:hypothetical protein
MHVMKRRALAAGSVSSLMLLAQLSRVDSAVRANQNSNDGLELICLAEQPAIVEGEGVALQAWVSTVEGRPVSQPTVFSWEVDAGRIEAQAAATKWDLSSVKVSPESERRAVATVKVTTTGRGELSCAVQVFIGQRVAALPDRGTVQAESLLSGRHYLLPGDVEPPGYGMYSYLLFSSPPSTAEERNRYLKTIEACLLVLQDVDDFLRRHVRRRNLNATYIPLKHLPDTGKSNADWAASVLAAYDYGSAQILLARIRQTRHGGPYLVSVLKPLSDPGASAHLWEDLTGVVPELAWNWIKFFTYLAAQERSWSEDSLQRFGLRLRNLIAVGSRIPPTVLKELNGAIVFRPQL